MRASSPIGIGTGLGFSFHHSLMLAIIIAIYTCSVLVSRDPSNIEVFNIAWPSPGMR